MRMTEAVQKRTNWALWLGLLFTLLGVLGNWLTFRRLSSDLFTWFIVACAALGLILSLFGAVRAFRFPEVYGGKVWGSLGTVLSLVVLAGSIMIFVLARSVPRSAGAPQVGQRLPEFTLPDSTGKPVSLSQLLAGAPGGPPPKGVLVVFYRGYW